MNWNNYKEWLQEKVIEITPSGGLNYYTILEPIKKKYPSDDNYRELINQLEKLFASIENCYENNSFGFNSNIMDRDNGSKYHSLPNFFKENAENNTETFNTWGQMFPDYNDTCFGEQKSIKEPMSKEIFDVLAGIHQMYLREISLLEALTRKANEYASENTNSIDPATLKHKYRDWLKQYQTLSHAHQDKMTFEAKTVEDLLRDLENINNNQQQNNNDNGDKPLPSGGSNLITYGIYGVIVVAVLGFLYLLKRWLF